MGEIRANVKLENVFDRYAKKKNIRSIELDCLVDTGAVLSFLPQEVVELLGLPEIGSVIVTYANEKKEELKKVGPVYFSIGERTGSFDCIVGPPNCEPLVGQIVLDELDLILDPANKTLSVRPESPYLPLLKLK
ncbi:MAG: hypothetical protein U9O87_00900 [Verrucomicrobiota bacterium]|nr:hypothetical protein [Verrucomicrobiota bacterium]